MDPSRTLPVSWVRITETGFDTAQRASPKPWSTQGQGPHERRLPVLMQCSQAKDMLFAMGKVAVKLASGRK